MTQNGTQSRPAIPVGLRLGQVIGQAQSVLLTTADGTIQLADAGAEGGRS